MEIEGESLDDIRQPGCHGWRHPMRLVRPDPVVPDGTEGNHVVIDLLRVTRGAPELSCLASSNMFIS